LVCAGVRNAAERLLYVASPALRYPARVPGAGLEWVTGSSVTLSNMAPGAYTARWYDVCQGAWVGMTRAEVSAGVLVLPVVDFLEDLAGRVTRDPRLTIELGPGAGLTLGLDTDPGLVHELEASQDLRSWFPVSEVEPLTGSGVWRVSSEGERFFRVVGW
jgi:hypothetical protein